MKQPHKLFGARRRAPNDGGALSRSGCFTKRAAAQRRLDLAAFVLRAIPPDEFMAIMRTPRPPSIAELVTLARQYVAEIPCPHCGAPLPLPTTTQD